VLKPQLRDKTAARRQPGGVKTTKSVTGRRLVVLKPQISDRTAAGGVKTTNQ
jgi:hypothetical protein